MSAFPEGLDPVEDLTAARWVTSAVQDRTDGPLLVRDMVPAIFEAYARILHQVRTEDEGRASNDTWSRRAAELGRELEPTTSWWDLIGTAPFRSRPGDPMPEMGRLMKHEAKGLASILDTSGDQNGCWFGIWSGWGFLSPGGRAELRPMGSWFTEWRERRRSDREARRQAIRLPPQITILGEPCFLIHGKVADAARFTFDGWFQSPTLWWPDDRTWFVHTDVEGLSTYLGGPREIVDRLVGELALESFEVQEDTVATQ
jgi:hypothetical protein